MWKCLLLLKAVLIVFDIMLSLTAFISTRSGEQSVATLGKLIGIVFALNAIAIF